VTRKSLRHEIHTTSQRLYLRREQFQQTNEQSLIALQKAHPYLIISAGLIAGAAMSAMGWHKAYTAASFSFNFYSFLISIPSLLMGIKK
jgi:uncharacterized membrane protein YkgB